MNNLINLIKEYQDQYGLTKQQVIRDLLTDLMAICYYNSINLKQTFQSASEVFQEDLELAQNIQNPCPNCNNAVLEDEDYIVGCPNCGKAYIKKID